MSSSAGNSLEGKRDRAEAGGQMVGVRFGNYQALSLLGTGGMSEVYLAEHPEIGRQVAIKVLSESVAEVPNAARRFLVEARAVTRVKHPNVVDLYDFGRLECGRPYYVMEFLQGWPLSHLLAQDGWLEPAAMADHVQQICAGLQAAHDADIVHRDLKPENIYLLEAGPPLLKILDFGIAKVLEREGVSQTATGVVMGTPLVIAPEQAAGHPDRIGPHTDLYSLGVILFWMIAGRPPFTDQAPGLLLSRHLNDKAPDLLSLRPSIPPALAQVVSDCLRKEPHNRPRSAAEVARRFVAALEGSAVMETSSRAGLDSFGMTTEQPMVEDEGSMDGQVAAAGSVTLTIDGESGITAAWEHETPASIRPRWRRPALALVGLLLLGLGVLFLYSVIPGTADEDSSLSQAPKVGRPAASAAQPSGNMPRSVAAKDPPRVEIKQEPPARPALELPREPAARQPPGRASRPRSVRRPGAARQPSASKPTKPPKAAPAAAAAGPAADSPGATPTTSTAAVKAAPTPSPSAAAVGEGTMDPYASQ